MILLVVTEKVYEEVSTDASASESEDPGPAKQEPKKTQPAKQVPVTDYYIWTTSESKVKKNMHLGQGIHIKLFSLLRNSNITIGINLPITFGLLMHLFCSFFHCKSNEF